MSALSPEARELLEATRKAGGPTAAQRAAMKHAVLAVVAVPASTAAAGAGGVKAAGLGLAAKLGMVAVAVCVAAGLVWRIQGAKEVAPGVVNGSVGTVQPAATDRAAIDQVAIDRAAIDQAASDRAASDRAASDRAANDRAANDQVANDQVANDQVANHPAANDPAAQRVNSATVSPGAPDGLEPHSSRMRSKDDSVLPLSKDAPSARDERGSSPEAQQPSLPPVVDDATLSREVAALSSAMGAVDGKHFAAALDQLTNYRAEFPVRALDTEASVVEVLALCGLGRVDEARAAAASLPANNPAVRRLERSCIAAGK
jgi:hypothetical protein